MTRHGFNGACVLLFLIACSFVAFHSAIAQTHGASGAQLTPTTRPEMVYVQDFEIDSADIQTEQGVLGQRGAGGGILRGPGVLRGRDDPQSTAVKLTNLLSTSLVEDLKKSSLNAQRISPGYPMPRRGWLIQGQFVEVNEGNRVQRAVIGFGAGATDMIIEVQVTDLTARPETPFLIFGTQNSSGKKPGAAVTLNPYVAAAKFVLSKNASDKDVKHAATQIADEIVKYMQSHGLMTP